MRAISGSTDPEYEFPSPGQHPRKAKRGGQVPHPSSEPLQPAGRVRTRGGRSPGRAREGVITGYALKLIRESIGLSQETLAEHLRVDRNTIQGWETGRRSLTGTRVGTLIEVRHRLLRLGADPRLLASLEDATEADYLLTYALSVDPTIITPADHPLASWVTKRSFTYMLAWPFTGRVPLRLRGPAPRHGPVAQAPALSADERERFFEHLRMIAERSLTDRDLPEASGALLRRNVYYPLAWNQSGEAEAWLREMERIEKRRLSRPDTWSPYWAAVRSLAVAHARQGDQEPLRDFIHRAISSDACQAASLNYWAYWIGEVPDTYTSDEFMASDLGPWRGTALLRRLDANLVAAEPVVDLYAHSVWALLERRARILDDDPELARSLSDRVDVLLAEGDLSAQSRTELEHVAYALRLLRSSLPTSTRTREAG
jgi:transcriptional regulator with XRE-family HTH domain